MTGLRGTARFAWSGRVLLDAEYPGPVATPFVLVHGIGVGAAYFRRLAPLLAAHGAVHVVELPGFGRAPKPAHALSVEEHAELLAAFLRTFDRPVVLVGHSMGAQVVLDAALRAPERVDRVIAIGAVTDRAERTAWLQSVRLAQDVLTETPAANAAVFAEYLRCGPRRYLATLPSMLDYDTAGAVAASTVPMLLVRGSRDPICRRPWARELAAASSLASLVEVPGARHVAMFTHPRSTASAILHAGIRR